MNNPMPTTAAKTYEVRGYQQALINATHAEWHKGTTSQLIESPPGSGKTFIGLTIGKRIIEDAELLFKCKPSEVGITWVAMRSNLLVQAEAENAGINCPNVHFMSMFDNDPGKFAKMYKKNIVVCDEAHHESTDTCHHLLNVIDPVYTVGLSATPMRADKAKLCFQKTHKEAGFYRLIELGYLSKFNQWMLDNWSPRTVASAYLAEKDKWGRSIMFFRTYEECKECNDILAAAGVRVDIVTGNTDRFAQIDLLEEGKTDVLINMFVLTEGFDFPPLCTVWVRDSSQGPTVQMAGRVLRKHQNMIKNVVQSVNSDYPFTRLAPAHEQYLMVNNAWRTVGKSELYQIMEKRMLERIMHIKVEIPDYIRKAQEKGRRFRRRAGQIERLENLNRE